MTSPRFPVFKPKGAIDIPGNDDRHNFQDPNSGGGPRSMPKPVPGSARGGFGHKGQRVHVRAQMPRGRGPAGNPASRGSQPGAMRPDQRISGHGGSAQTGARMPGFQARGGMGASGQSDLPSYPKSSPQPSAGNTSGRSYRLIAGRFKRAAMGAKPTGDGGKYGSNPVSANT